MKEFMIEATIPTEWTKNFIGKIPEQKEMLEDLVDEGKLEFYSLALDRSKLWMLIKAEDEQEVEEILAEFPIYDEMEFEIINLMFARSSSKVMASFSLN